MMSRARTPVHFPRMKVRGQRNRRKLAARYRYITIIPYARPVRTATGYRFDVMSAPEPGAVAIRHTITRDGYGRGVRGGGDSPGP